MNWAIIKDFIGWNIVRFIFFFMFSAFHILFKKYFLVQILFSDILKAYCFAFYKSKLSVIMSKRFCFSIKDKDWQVRLKRQNPNTCFKYYCCCCWVIKSCLTLWDSMNCSTPGFSVYHQLLEPAPTQVHESVMPSNHLISVNPFSSCSQTFPASGSFPKSQLFTLAGQRIWASASVLPMNIHGWFPLGLTGLISLLSKCSQDSSPAPQFKSINFSMLSLLYGPTFTPITWLLEKPKVWLYRPFWQLCL